MAYKRMNSLRMEPHSNGVVISWDEIHESPVAGQTYSNRDYKPKSEVYEVDHDEEGGGEGMKKAMGRYQELLVKHMKEKASGIK